ncbi:MAG: HD domain-containing protein [Candidatus Heimdallarchaeota archaeon]|nr:MAG: HD domain-containing protein [Candidatus Heimdallarchaeota archaeon]
MDFLNNITQMKRLLRQGWVRAGVPLSSIESLADHSWSVAALTYYFCILENNLREYKTHKIDIQKAVLIALFHDLHESEFFDIDKSARFISPETLDEFQNHLEEGAIQNIISKVQIPVKDSLESLLRDHGSEEYHIARVADLFELLHQANEYWKKRWIDMNQYEQFSSHALKQLKPYENQFSFLEKYLLEFKSQ